MGVWEDADLIGLAGHSRFSPEDSSKRGSGWTRYRGEEPVYAHAPPPPTSGFGVGMIVCFQKK